MKEKLGIPPYSVDKYHGKNCYFRQTERGTKSRPIMEVNGRFVYITPELLMAKQRKIEARPDFRSNGHKFDWNPFWGEDAEWKAR